MNEYEKAVAAMESHLAQWFQCDEQNIDLGGLQLGTTWVDGQDYYADYTVNHENLKHPATGTVYWSHVGQDVHRR